MAQQPLVGQGLLTVEASRPHSVGILWTSDQSETEIRRNLLCPCTAHCPNSST